MTTILPTRDGRAKVLLPPPATFAEACAQIERITAEEERLGIGRDGIGIVDTTAGREVRSYRPEADAFVLSLAAPEKGAR